jgi:molybdopterin synthase catalytic subunit
MSVQVTIVDGPLASIGPGTPREGAGAVLLFEGVVRRIEEEREVLALSYEVYEPMATRMLSRIGEELMGKHGLIGLSVVHSRGVVPVGRASLRVVIESRHRGAALAAMGEFIDLLKRDVPIWKMPVWKEKAEGAASGE